MNCEHTREQLADWLKDGLTKTEKSEVELHLIHCLQCQEEFEASRQLWTTMNQVQVLVPGEAMKVQFNTMLNDYKKTTKIKKKSIAPDWIRQVREFLTPQLALQLGFSLLLVGLGWIIGYRMKSPAAPSVAYEQQIDTLAGQVEKMKQMMTLALITNSSATERIRAVSYTDGAEADERVLEALFSTLNSDSNVNVRLVTLEALTQFAGDPLVRTELVKSLAHQDSPMVQIAMADVMVRFQEKRSVKALRELLKKENLNDLVKNKIEQTIKDLS